MNVRVKNQPTSQQKKVLRQEVIKEFDKLLARYNRSTAIQVMHILRFDFGFGQERLQKFADKLCEMQKRQEEFYELPPDDTPWLCERQLRESGIDIDAILEDN
jgi:DNA polymerase III epsilon subunit-like protein